MDNLEGIKRLNEALKGFVETTNKLAQDEIEFGKIHGTLDPVTPEVYGIVLNRLMFGEIAKVMTVLAGVLSEHLRESGEG